MTIPYEKPIKIVLWITIFMMSMSLIMFGVLARAGGNGPGLKRAIEDYLSAATGMRAKIEMLDTLEFFPHIVIDFKGLSMTAPDKIDPSVKIGTVYIEAKFLDFLWRTGKFQKIIVTDINAAPGTIMDEPFAMFGVTVMDQENWPTAIVGAGVIGDERFTLTLPVDRVDNAYRIKKDAAYEIVTENGEHKPIGFRNGKITIGEEE